MRISSQLFIKYNSAVSVFGTAPSKSSFVDLVSIVVLISITLE